MKEDKKIKLYAVYGTLKKGHGNYKWHLENEETEYLGNTETEAKFSLYSLGGFPGLKNDGTTKVNIDVFKINSEEVEEGVDRLEGFREFNHPNNFYNKEVIDTKFGKAYVYIYNGNIREESLIENGNWG